MKPSNTVLQHPHSWLRTAVLFGLSIIAFFAVYLTPLPDFSLAAHKTLAIFACAAFLWMTDALPIAVTGILILLLIPLTGALSAHTTYSYFGSPAVFFILGAFILASPVMRSGLSTRLAVKILKHTGKGPKRFLLALGLLAGFLSFFISEHAVAVMLFPIVVAITAGIGTEKHPDFTFAVFMAMAWGAVIGGTATLLGGARAALALGMLESNTHQTISFLHWTYWVIPLVLAMFIVACITTCFIARKSTISMQTARDSLAKKAEALGSFSGREMKTAAVLVLTIIGWISFSSTLDLDAIAFIGVIGAFLLRITNWHEVEEDVNWGIVLTYGSAIALSAAMRDTGAAKDLVHQLILNGLTSPVIIMVVLVLLAGFLTEAMSNAAAVAVLMPIGLAFSAQFHMDPRAVTLAIATSAGLTFLLPVSTPTMAIVSGADAVPQLRLLRWGIVLKVIGLGLLFILMFGYWPKVGLHI
jgi:sodium-dependent dicarboxylate transporter 2/3/5